MARGSSRRMMGHHPNGNNDTATRGEETPQSAAEVLDELDRNAWTHMVPGAKSFLLRKRNYDNGLLPGHIEITELVKFWTNPVHIKYTIGEVAMSQCGASWYIASKYLELGFVEEARTLTLNGGFFHECYNTPIEEIIIRVNGTHDLPNPNRGWVFPHGTLRDFGLDLYRGALFAANRAPDEMLWYLYKNLPKDYQNMMSKFSSLTTNDNRTKFSDQIGDAWGGASPASKKIARHLRKTTTGSHIELFLQDDVKEEERHGFSIGSGTTLKTLFNDYADKRGISLRSLRFSYNGKTLFLSSVGNKTPDELSMSDQDVISVHETGAVEDTRDDRPSPSNKTSKKSSSKKKSSPKRSKGKGKKKQDKHEKPILSPEECKALHSKTLTKLHEEAEPQLKEIRMRLNALDLERQPPKQKNRKNKKKSIKPSSGNADLQILPSSGIGGKAGKPFFHIHVGEVSNLYKTTKPSQKGTSVCTLAHSSTTLDLHGFTQEEALQKLDESLITWVDAAMRGSYPFVIPAKIVCGCGNQVISEVVEKWIHEHTQVRNSPKLGWCR